MKPFSRVAIAAVVLLMSATLAAADTPLLLNKLEVQKLVAAGSAVANLRLAAHFKAVADRYDEDAAHYRAAATVFKANANRSAATNAALSWERQSARATEWGAAARAVATYHASLASGTAAVVPRGAADLQAARAVATYHASLASGTAAVVPRGAAELQAGRGAPEPTAEQLHKLALTARTRTDHLELEEYYQVVARKKAAEADHHLRMATGFAAGVRHGTYDAAVTRERLARLARTAARTAEEAASRHRVLATVA